MNILHILHNKRIQLKKQLPSNKKNIYIKKECVRRGRFSWLYYSNQQTFFLALQQREFSGKCDCHENDLNGHKMVIFVMHNLYFFLLIFGWNVI